MSNFYARMERFLLKFLAVLLILLISTQILLKEEGARNLLEQVESFLHFQEARPVIQEGHYCLVLLKLEEGGHPELKVLINNRVVDDFTSALVRVYVQEGDYLAVESREKINRLKLTIEGLSEPLLNIAEGDSFIIRERRLELGRIWRQNSL
ncbi:MAG: hypothetical protein UMV23_07165 [Halanaerobium sp.]|nr:hypothetical protein [Halanaerobium sp.]